MPADVTFVPKHGVVSLLDPMSSERVRTIWRRLDREGGFRGVLVMPHPHFSYQIAAGYDREALEATLRALARTVKPFTIRTTGLGEFNGPWPTIFIAIERTPRLSAIHENVWNACLPHSRAPMDYYRPEAWVPHITLAHGEERNSVPLSEDDVTRVRKILRGEDFPTDLTINNLSLVWDEGAIQRPVSSFRLSGT